MKGFVPVLLTVILFLGCHRNIQNKEAVKQGVEDYLAGRSGLMPMNVTISAVKFNGNEADALVYLTAKNGTATGGGMQMRYVLERQGNKWVVKPHSGTSPHAGAERMPLNPHGGVNPGAGAMPQGDMQQLPPGHPPIGQQPGQSR